MNNSNLKPFTVRDDPRRLNGRPKGAKNLKTIIRELENEEFDWNKIPQQSKGFSHYLKRVGSPWRAIVMRAMLDAINGNKDAREWLTKIALDDKSQTEIETREPIIMSNIEPRFNNLSCPDID